MGKVRLTNDELTDICIAMQSDNRDMLNKVVEYGVEIDNSKLAEMISITSANGINPFLENSQRLLIGNIKALISVNRKLRMYLFKEELNND